MTNFVLEDEGGTEVSISNAEEVKFIGSGITTSWTNTSNGTDGDPFDLTFTVDAAQTGITSILATDLKIGEDDQTKIDFETPDEIHFYAGNAERVYLGKTVFGPQTDSVVDLGETGVRWKDAYIDGITTDSVNVENSVVLTDKTITMIGDTNDNATITASTNGSLSIVTNDQTAAAANIQITADGTFKVDATTITLDSLGDIVLDADGADIIFKDAGTSIASFSNDSSNFVIESKVQDKNIVFKGNDGGSVITALTLNMSAGGAATFKGAIATGGNIVIPDGGNIGSVSDPDAIAIAANGLVTINESLTVDNVTIDGNEITMTGSTGDTATIRVDTNGALTIVTDDNDAAAANIQITADGTFKVDATTITLDSLGDIVLDADGADIIFKDAGTSIASFSNDSSNFVIESKVQDKNIVFKGNDGGSVITALTLHMKDGGAATFKDSITTGGNIMIPNTGNIGSVGDPDAIAIAANGIVTINESLTVDDVTIDGKVITMIGSTGDTATITAGTNGTLEIETKDTGAAAANITIKADGNITLDSVGNITLDADTGVVVFQDDGTSIATFSNSSNDFVIESKVAEKDIIFKGSDGSSVTALTLDMSASGAAIFNNSVTATALTVDDVTIDGKVITMIGSTGDTATITAGTNGTLEIETKDTGGTDADITIKADGKITLDAEGAEVEIANGGTTIGTFKKSVDNFVIESKVSDGDILFQGNDGGSTVTALTLDMSDAGAATFNSNVTANGALIFGTETLTASTAASLVKTVTLLNPPSSTQTYTLADGTTAGQVKIFTQMAAKISDITPNARAGAYVKITMDTEGQSCKLMWSGSGWVILSRSSGATASATAVAGLPVVAL
jgi:biopolymer transport protein ExbD